MLLPASLQDVNLNVLDSVASFTDLDYSPHMANSNPMATTYSTPPPAVSKKTFTIAGIRTTVYGLDELDHSVKDVACLWLLHPRLQTQASMELLAASNINEWNLRFQRGKGNGASVGLIAVSFDQRNHGSREVDHMANQTWRSGNETHAQDMFSIFHGTAVDVSLLITYLPSYIFPTSNHTVSTNLVCGVSLGGHCAWVSCQCRITNIYHVRSDINYHAYGSALHPPRCPHHHCGRRHWMP